VSSAVRVLAYAWDHEGLGHVARLLNVISGIRELCPEAAVSILAEQDSELLRQSGHPYAPVPAHRDSYLGEVPGTRQDERPLERAVAAAAAAAAARVARPTVVLHDSVVSADLLRAVPPRQAPHVLVLRRNKSMAALLESMGEGLDDLAMVILPHEPGEVPAAEIPRRLRARTVFTGPIVRPVAAGSTAAMRSRYGVPTGHRMIVVTGGGGGFADQHVLFDSAARAIARTATTPTVGVLVLGYFFNGIAVLPAAGAGLTWRVTRHEPELPALMGAADVVIAQGGYNTLFEARSAGARVVAVPGIRSSDNQARRTRQMARDDPNAVAVDGPDADAIASAITSLCRSRRRPAAGGQSAGRLRAAAAIIELAGRPAS
jgi:UDP-N-acetylglucosamine:LPS N-acetylglucosamine transferase